MQQVFENFTDEELILITKYLEMAINASHEITLELREKKKNKFSH